MNIIGNIIGNRLDLQTWALPTSISVASWSSSVPVKMCRVL